MSKKDFLSQTNPNIDSLEKAVSELKQSGATKGVTAQNATGTSAILDIAMNQVKLLNQYYAEAFNRANKTFYFALIIAIIGCGFFFAGAALTYGDKQYANLGLISGPIAAVVSGVAIYFHEKNLPALTDSSNKIDRMQRIILAYALFNQLDANRGDKDNTLAELIKAIASA